MLQRVGCYARMSALACNHCFEPGPLPSSLHLKNPSRIKRGATRCASTGDPLALCQSDDIWEMRAVPSHDREQCHRRSKRVWSRERDASQCWKAAEGPLATLRHHQDSRGPGVGAPGPRSESVLKMLALKIPESRCQTKPRQTPTNIIPTKIA